MTFPVRTMIGPMPIGGETSRMSDVFPAGNFVGTTSMRPIGGGVPKVTGSHQ